MHGFRCYDNMAPNAKCQRVLVYSLYAWLLAVVTVLILPIKAKFHYASWFEAGSKLVADRFEAKFHYAIWFEPASNQLQTSSEPTSVMEFGLYQIGVNRFYLLTDAINDWRNTETPFTRYNRLSNRLYNAV